jgi:hypothetical protein
VNELRTTGLLIDKKTKYKRRVLTEEKLDDVGASLEHTPRNSVKLLAQETGVSKSGARTATQLLKLRPYKTTVILAFQPCDSASRVRFCIWFLKSVVEGEIDPQLTFSSDEAWFHLQGYINTQNNRYWSSQTPHLTHKAPLHPVKVGVWCALSARRTVGPVFFNETVNCKRYIQVILGQFFSELTEEERLYGWFQQDSALLTLHMCLYRLCPIYSGAELSAVIFGQHVHLTLNLVIFFLGMFEGQSLQQ